MDGLTPTTFIFLWVEVLKTSIEKLSSSHNQDFQVFKMCTLLLNYIISYKGSTLSPID